jgi:hypothetical protein
MLCVCLPNYGAGEAFYPCIVVEKIHEYFRSKNAPISLQMRLVFFVLFLLYQIQSLLTGALSSYTTSSCWKLSGRLGFILYMKKLMNVLMSLLQCTERNTGCD